MLEEGDLRNRLKNAYETIKESIFKKRFGIKSKFYVVKVKIVLEKLIFVYKAVGGGQK